MSYSALAAVQDAADVTSDFDNDTWRGTRGWSSEGVEGPEELEKKEPPSKGFFPLDLDLSSSEI